LRTALEPGRPGAVGAGAVSAVPHAPQNR